MITSPALQSSVAQNLLDYLQDHLGIPEVRFAEEPVQITLGWETYIYRFRLRPTAGLPPEYTDRLILRAYSSVHGLSRARHEFAAQEAMVRLGYPAPRPLLLEERCEPFGGPFLVMEWLPGQTLVELLCDRPWRIWGGPVQMADMHAQLHRLPLDGFPRRVGPFLERRLDEMREHLREHGLNGMVSGFDWLWRHRPEPPPRPCIIHLDFHPVNLLFEHGECRAVLDWNESDVGDPHADVAATVVLINTAPIELPGWWHRLAAWEARPMLRRRYLRAYRRRRPLDRGKLAYYTAWAAFRRLVTWGIWLHGTPHLTGSKLSSLHYVKADRVNLLRDCFHRWAGVGVRI